MASENPIHSTGRGGAGNIGHDPHTYTDGGIVREGFHGESTDGAFSAGRGGAGNIAKSPALGPTTGRRGSQDMIPETALRQPQENFHTGRGGEGNVHREAFGGHSKEHTEHKSVKDKVKGIFQTKDKPATEG